MACKAEVPLGHLLQVILQYYQLGVLPAVSDTILYRSMTMAAYCIRLSTGQLFCQLLLICL